MLAAIILPIMTYFAGVQRGKMNKTEDQKEQRIAAVVEKFMSNPGSLGELLNADIASLHDDSEIQEVFKRICRRGKRHPVPECYRTPLEGGDFHGFFARLAADKDILSRAADVEALVDEFKKSS